MCGNKALAYRFEQPGIVSELHIVWDKPTTATIPRIVSRFPTIISFSLIPHSCITSLELYQFNPDWLPPTVRKLYIVAKWVTASAYSPRPNKGWFLNYYAFNLQNRFPMLEDIRIKAFLGELANRGIGIQPPSPPLRSLVLSAFVTNRADYTFEYFAKGGAVHSLSTFGMEAIELSRNMELADPEEDFTFLFRTPSQTIPPSGPVCWPASVTSLKVQRFIHSWRVMQRCTLPPNLTKLNFAHFTWDNRSFQLLPRSLTDLRTKRSITVTSSVWARFTPPELRILHAKLITINSDVPALLPSSLTELKLFFRRKSRQTFEVGDSQLVSLTIPSTNQIFGPAFWTSLPDSLTELEVCKNLHPILNVPKNLRSLKIAGSLDCLGFGELFQDISPTMGTLALCMHSSPRLYSNFDVTKLPVHLTSLTMTCEPQFSSDDFSCLPRQLTLLALKNPYKNQDANYFHLLPRGSLTSLHLHVVSVSSENLRGLPRSLRDLFLRYNGFESGLYQCLDTDFKASLPPNLLKIRLLSAFGCASVGSFPSFHRFKQEWRREFPTRILKTEKEKLDVPWPY